MFGNCNKSKLKKPCAHLSQSRTKISFIIISKWFEPKSISSLSSVIVRVSVVLKRPVGDSD